ncbi:MAG TPA: SCO family protein [Solirubrobacteraceae bacterium]
MRRRTASFLPVLALVAVVLALVAVIVVLLLSGASNSHGGRSSESATSVELQLGGAQFPGRISAPPFTLTNQSEDRVSLSDYRGQVVVLSFLYSTCGDTCILIGQQIRGALNELQEEHARLPAVLIVSADPQADTPGNVGRFLAEVSLTGRVQYLTGTPAQLRAVWRAYEIKPASDGRTVFDEYAPVLLIDPAGHKRELFESEELTPEGISHDVERLDGDATHH